MWERIPWWFRRKDGKTVERTASDYTAVASVGGALISLLREHLVPEVVEGRESIGLCTASEHGDLVLGAWLYDIRENEEVRLNGMIPYDGARQQFPPLYLNLYYMITVYSQADLRYRAEEEQRILGKTMQILRDHSVWSSETLLPVETEGENSLHVEYLNLTVEEKMKIWSCSNSPYNLSLFYRVAPVELQSSILRKVARVREIQVEIPQKGGGEGYD